MQIDPNKCVGCCACQGSCPVGAINFVEGKCTIDSAKCVNCGTCASLCPMSAIS